MKTDYVLFYVFHSEFFFCLLTLITLRNVLFRDVVISYAFSLPPLSPDSLSCFLCYSYWEGVNVVFTLCLSAGSCLQAPEISRAKLFVYRQYRAAHFTPPCVSLLCLLVEYIPLSAALFFSLEISQRFGKVKGPSSSRKSLLPQLNCLNSFT